MPKETTRLTHSNIKILKEAEYYTLQGIFEKLQEIVMYYGFTPIHLPMVEHEEFVLKTAGKQPEKLSETLYSIKQPKNGDKLSLLHSSAPGFIRTYLDEEMLGLPQPVMLYSFGPRYQNIKDTNHEHFRFDLEVIGSSKSIMDALLIRIAMLGFEDFGGKNIIVHINSLGDKTCRSHYIKELTNYYRKHINTLDKDDRQLLKDDPLLVLLSSKESTREVNLHAPDPLSYLTSECKKQFKEVLEYLDELGIAYRIDKKIIHELESDSHTMFEIRGYKEQEDEALNENESFVLARGGRHDNLMKMLGSKKDVPAVGVSIDINTLMTMSWFKAQNPRNVKEPKVYFIQLGTEAKMKSLAVIEHLRKAKIPVMKALSKDSLQAQLSVAEKIGVPYTIIFGQKEAIEGTVIIRSMKSRSQKTVKIDKMVEELKKVK
jgi:histidyl-tRNA synthetase